MRFSACQTDLAQGALCDQEHMCSVRQTEALCRGRVGQCAGPTIISIRARNPPLGLPISVSSPRVDSQTSLNVSQVLMLEHTFDAITISRIESVQATPRTVLPGDRVKVLRSCSVRPSQVKA